MKKIIINHIRNRNHYDIPKDVLVDFLKRPASERVVTLGIPESYDSCFSDTPEELMQKSGVGTIDMIREKDGELLADMTIDQSLPCGKILADLLKGEVTLGFSLGGVGEASPDDPDQIQFTDITHVAILPELGENAK